MSAQEQEDMDEGKRRGQGHRRVDKWMDGENEGKRAMPRTWDEDEFKVMVERERGSRASIWVSPRAKIWTWKR